MKSSNEKRAPNGSASNDGGPSPPQNNLGGGTAASASTQGSSHKAAAAALRHEDAATTCASSPRLSDESCSDSGSSDRLSSGESFLSASRKTVPIQPLLKTGQRTQTQSLTSFGPDSIPCVQSLVLQGRLMTGDGVTSGAVESSCSMKQAAFPSFIRGQLHPGISFQAIVGKGKDAANPNAAHRGEQTGAVQKTDSTAGSPGQRQHFPASHQPQPDHRPLLKLHTWSSEGREKKSTEEKRREHRMIRALPKSLTDRTILTRLVRQSFH